MENLLRKYHISAVRRRRHDARELAIRLRRRAAGHAAASRQGSAPQERPERRLPGVTVPVLIESQRRAADLSPPPSLSVQPVTLIVNGGSDFGSAQPSVTLMTMPE